MTETRDRPAGRGWAVVALALVAAAFAPSLGGGWVWDDHYLFEGVEALSDPTRLVAADHYARLSEGDSHVWRPLVLLTFVPGAWVEGGAPWERVISLLGHLGVVAGVGALARRFGARLAAAWLGAAVFGLHPGVVETVAWPSGRPDLLLGAAFVAAALAWATRRPVLCGVLLGAAFFAKEAALAAPVALALWWLGSPGQVGRAAAFLIALGAAYLGLRSAVGVGWAPASEPLALVAGLGGVVQRALTMMAVPAAAGPLPVLAPSLGLGVLALVGALGAAVASRGRPRLATGLGLCAPVALQAAAATATGTADDRYLYVALATMGLATALGVEAALARAPRAVVAWAVPVTLGLLTVGRAWEWRSDATLFTAALARDPDNAGLAFRLGYDIHTRGGDCAAAVPLYVRGISDDSRAATNLLACLVALDRHEEAVALAPALLQRAPDNAGLAANAARSALAVGRLDLAEGFALEATRRAPEDPARWVLLGQVRGQRGELDGAEAAFIAALDRDPGHEGALAGLAAVNRLR